MDTTRKPGIDHYYYQSHGFAARSDAMGDRRCTSRKPHSSASQSADLCTVQSLITSFHRTLSRDVILCRNRSLPKQMNGCDWVVARERKLRNRAKRPSANCVLEMLQHAKFQCDHTRGWISNRALGKLLVVPYSSCTLSLTIQNHCLITQQLSIALYIYCREHSHLFHTARLRTPP